ncbi:ATP-binding protein [Streptomyces sp. SID2999]|uniref:ATP-binding protein n=1 Tax=Streptomyces sp. SID2999 TaxID=2690258 RepID=UPI00136D76A0|nr:ATP-binding protein [Streptomyces sp. SID2999]
MNQEYTGAAAQLDARARDFSVLFSSTPRGARLARLLAAEQLRSWGLPWEAAAQIVAELAANAATHGRLPGRSFRLALHAARGTLRIEVTDTRGDRRPVRREPGAEDEGGRGLLLVAGLAGRWGVAEDRFPRKIVWAELDFTSPDSGHRAPVGRGVIKTWKTGGKHPTKPHPSRPRRQPHSGG